MTARLAHIRRHPIKSIGGEELERTALTAARRLPGDREWAVLTDSGEPKAKASQAGGEPDRWLPKSCFVRGVASSAVQATTGGWAGDKLVLHHPARPDLSFDPASGSDEMVEWLLPLWPVGAAAPTRLVRGAGIWTDQKWPWISILSLASLAELEQKTGQPLGVHRWRGNLWVDGWKPWAERAMIGQVISIGNVEVRVTQHIGRCDATCANTTTGRRDIDMLEALERLYGRTDFGVFAEVVTGGDIAVGDRIAA